MSSIAMEHNLRPVEDGTKRNAIIEAIAGYDLVSSDAWNDLDQLSTYTEFDEIDAVPEGIFELNETNFQAAATVFITLSYGDKNDRTSMSDSYPASVSGTYDATTHKASVIEFAVDTSSFYR